MDVRSLLNPGSPPPAALSPPRSRMSLDALLGSSTVHSPNSSPFHGSTASPFYDPVAGRTTRGEDDTEEEEDAIALAGGGTLYFGKEARRASADAAVPSGGIPAPQFAAEEERTIQRQELPSVALPSEDSPMELDDPIPSSSRQPPRPTAATDAMDLDPVPSPSPSSSHLVPDSDADADGEEDPSIAFSDAPEPAIKPEDLEVDIMSHDSSESPPPQLRLHPLPKPKKATQAQKKAARVKGGKARQALYGSLSIASPHSLSHELSIADDEGSEETTREGTPEGSHAPVRMPFAFPSVADAVRTPLPEGAVESAFEGYVPHKGSDTEDEGEKVRTRKGKGRVKEVEQEVEEGDDRLYCVCRRLYDPERTMIACDKCENWYHLDCIDITDKKVDLVDQFICPICQQSSSDRTTWKTRCARPTCLHPVVPLSKYCSDYCGIEVAATRLELCGMDPERFWPNVVGARRREGAVLDSSLPRAQSVEEARKEEDEDERTLAALRAKLSDLVARRQVLDGNLALINARLRYLRIAIRRWEALCQATADALASEGIQSVASSSKSKAKGRSRKAGAGPVPATSLPDAQCGLDVRLVYDRAAWEAWVEGEEGRAVLAREEGKEVEEGFEMPDEVCMRPKKKCERHTGWQKVRQADFEVERAVLTRRLDRLAVDERRIRGRIEDHEEASRFRALHRHRVGDAISVEGKMKAPVRMTPTKPQWGGRAVGGAAGGNLVNGTVVAAKEVVAAPSPFEVERSSYELGDEEGYDVPPEVYAFLSRSEQLKVRGRAR